MKRFVLFLFAIFTCAIAYAEQITINWGVDNQLYTTTTCEVGGDVTLPSVSKRGYIFRGWTPEHFNRGTFADWNAVPTTETGYLQNIYGNRTPLKGDYIIVNNAIGINFNNPIHIKVVKNGYGVNEWTLSVDNGKSFYVSRRVSPKDIVIKQYENFELRFEGYTEIVQIYANINMKYNGVVVSAGDPIISFWYNVSNGTEYIMYYNASGIDFSGTWRFVYDGIWETDGKDGWKPVEQIVSE